MENIAEAPKQENKDKKKSRIKHYGDDLKQKLEDGRITDYESVVHNICAARSEWLLRIAPVYNLASLRLSDAIIAAKEEGVFRFTVKKFMKTVDNYLERGLKEVVNFAVDKQGKKFILDIFDRYDDVMRRHASQLYYPIYNYLGRMDIRCMNTCSALSLVQTICDLCAKAEEDMEEKWLANYGYTIPLIANMYDAAYMVENALFTLEPKMKQIKITDDEICFKAISTFITNSFSIHMPNTAAGKALAMNPGISKQLDREALKEAKKDLKRTLSEV